MEYTDKTIEKMVADRLPLLDVHTGEENKFLRDKMVNDWCWKSYNNLEWKSTAFLDTKNEVKELKRALKNEVNDKLLDRKQALLVSMHNQMQGYRANLKADLKVYELRIDAKGWYKAGKKKVEGEDEVVTNILETNDSKASLMKV
jgi:hypothetical protein